MEDADEIRGSLTLRSTFFKPEKDPKAIAAAKNKAQAGYPKCLLCPENEGYAGAPAIPRGRTTGSFPLLLTGREWFSSIPLFLLPGTLHHTEKRNMYR